MKLLDQTATPFYLRNFGSAASNGFYPNIALNGFDNAAAVADTGNYGFSHKFYCTRGDNVARMEVGHLDDGAGHVTFPTTQVASQVKACVSALYLASRGDVASSIFFYTGSGGGSPSLAKRWEMNASGRLLPGANNSYDIGSTSLRVRSVLLNGPLVAGNAALATSARDGLIYIPSMSLGAGSPTGTPASYGSTVPLFYDTSNNVLYAYNGSWKKSAAFV